MRREFREKYLFTGRLVLKTGLHIGGGDTALGGGNAPVIRAPDGSPFIPGSSLKGAFRSTVEKLVAMIPGLRTCLLDEAAGRAACCMSPQNSPFGQAYRTVVSYQNRPIIFNNEEGVEALHTLDRAKLITPAGAERSTIIEERHLEDIREDFLCHTCRLFGSPYAAARINFSDLYPLEEETTGLIQLRNGVAIDRDSERAAENLLYDYEVVAPELAFELEIWLEEPTETDLALTCLGLSEFLSGFGYLGGKRSRGLGRCELQELAIYHLNLSEGQDIAANLLRYLKGRTPQDKMTPIEPVDDFINGQIEQLIQEDRHA